MTKSKGLKGILNFHLSVHLITGKATKVGRCKNTTINLIETLTEPSLVFFDHKHNLLLGQIVTLNLIHQLENSTKKHKQKNIFGVYHHIKPKGSNSFDH